jgi:DNA-binding response OmpR family regulator
MGGMKVLVADDEGRIRKLVTDFLVKDGYDVYEAADGQETLNFFKDIDDLKLVILDVMMPGLDGFHVLKKIRETSNIPVIMLTAKTSEEDELRGFDLGVDEYVQKPFSPKLLMARVNAVIRRSEEKSETEQDTNVLTAGKITLDVGAHVVMCNGEEVPLSVKEFELLNYFLNNQGIALSRDMILNNVWNYDFFGDARTIDTHVKKLRNKLGDCGDYIKTIWGMGYKFEAV